MSSRVQQRLPPPSSGRITDRFQKIPRLQQDRESEYARQATEAEELLRRLHQTRIEAESVAREEISRTRQIQVEQLRTHPEILKWKRSVAECQMQLKEWERTAAGRRRELTYHIHTLEGQLRAKQQELDRIQSEIKDSFDRDENLRQQISILEGRLSELRRDFERARRAEDSLGSQINNAHLERQRLEQDIEALRKEKSEWQSSIDELHGREASLKTERDGILSQLDRCRGQLIDWDRRVSDTEEQFARAIHVQSEAQAFMEKHRQRIEELNQDKARYADQVAQCLQQREDVKKLADTIVATIQTKEAKVRQLEDQAKPIKSRITDIQDSIKKLQEEMVGLDGRFVDLQKNFEQESNELETLKPALNDFQQQVAESTDLHRRAEQVYSDFIAKIFEESCKMDELEAKAQEAHREVQEAQNLRQEAQDGRKQASLAVNTFNSRAAEIATELDRINNQIESMVDGRGVSDVLAQKEQELVSYERELHKVLESKRSFQSKRENLGHQVGQAESELRLCQTGIESGKGPKLQSYKDRLRSELDTLQHELNLRQQEIPQMDSNPFEAQLMTLQREEKEVESCVYAVWTPESAPGPLISQLKRETEAVLRAEAALALERRQQAICQEALNLSRFHINTTPRIELDDDAKHTLLSEHREGSHDRQIAMSVLEMCEQHHIHT